MRQGSSHKVSATTSRYSLRLLRTEKPMGARVNERPSGLRVNVAGRVRSDLVEYPRNSHEVPRLPGLIPVEAEPAIQVLGRPKRALPRPGEPVVFQNVVPQRAPVDLSGYACANRTRHATRKTMATALRQQVKCVV